MRHSDPRLPMAPVHFGIGRILVGAGAPGLAAASFRRALRSDPGWSAARFALGDALGGAGRWSAAAAEYAALARRSRDPECQGNLVLALGRARRWPEALAACDRLIELVTGTEMGEILLLKGLILRRAGRRNEAILAFRRAAQLTPAAPGHRFFLGEALLGGEAWRAAVTSLAQARGVPLPASVVGGVLNAPPLPSRKPPVPRRVRAIGAWPRILSALRRLTATELRLPSCARRALRWLVGRAAAALAGCARQRPHVALRAIRAGYRLDELASGRRVGTTLGTFG